MKRAIVFLLGCFLVTGFASAVGNTIYRVTEEVKYLEMAKKAVVRVAVMGSGTCSATVISEKYLVTAAHCIPAPQLFFSYMLSTGQSPMYVIKSKTNLVPLGLEPRVDAGLVEGDFAALNKALDVDHFNGEVYKVTEAVLCGYPLYNNELRCVVAKRIKNQGFAAVFDTVAIPGQSGGAVFAKDGRLIGIIHSVDMEGHTNVASTAGVLSFARMNQQP